jgi:transcription initiation factor TFIIIB Brf1 subunit/transcription initiation factor TFIIB
MRGLLVTTLSVAVLAISAGWVLAENAATAAGPGDVAKARGERIAERLGLSAGQQEQMRTILKAAHEQAESSADREAKMKVMREAMEKIKATVLNDEQRKKFDEVRENPGDRARERVAEMADRLGLTPEQKEAAKAIMQAAHELAQNASEPAAKVRIFRDAMEKVRTTVLTDDQRKKFEAAREGRGPGSPGGPDNLAERVKEHMARMTERLGLTPAQQEAAREILKAAHEQAQNASEPEARAKIMREALEKVRTTILTDEQRKMMENARDESREHRPGAGGSGPRASTK